MGDRLLFIADLSARGKGSGVPIGGSLIGLFTYRAGRIVREQYFNTREEALEAAGLRERRFGGERGDSAAAE